MFILIAASAFSLSSFAGNTKEIPQVELMESAISEDFDQDGKRDLAFLTVADRDQSEYLTLWIKLNSENDYYKFDGISYNNNHGMYGVGTHLKVNDLGSLQVYSYNDAIGRNRWESTVTIAYRKNGLTLAGFTYSERDTLDLSSSVCDVNLLNQKGIFESTRNNKTASAKFSVNNNDVVRLGQFNYDNLVETYLNNYCYTFDLHESE